MRSAIQEARKLATIEEIDYVFLVTALKKWAAPRNVISRLVQSKDLIRVKKGIYLFGSDYAKRPYSPEVLANKIYGPSYVSAEYALSFWGLIPEGVMEVTSMTTGKSKRFSTPAGRFSYYHLKPMTFSVGVTHVRFSDEFGALIATPEKALADLLMNRKEAGHTLSDLRRVLYEDFRIDPQGFKQLKISMLKAINRFYQNQTLNTLIQLLTEEKKYARSHQEYVTKVYL